MSSKTYAELLRDPRWQKKRLEVFDRDDFTCRSCMCGKTPLNVHHLYYVKGKAPWDYPLDAFLTLCDLCHESEKKERPETEGDLLNELKMAGFLANDIGGIAEGIRLYDGAKTKYGWNVADVLYNVLIQKQWADLIYALMESCSGGDYRLSDKIFNSPEFTEMICAKSKQPTKERG